MIIHKPIFDFFEFEQVYHLFTRVSGNELIFKSDTNYQYFLRQLAKYLLPYSEIYAYCLVPTQFSLLLCFRSQKNICKNLNHSETELSKEQEHKFLMQPMSNLLNSYAKAYNKMYHRKGALFVDFIKREKLDDEESLKTIFRDIHLLPLQHRLVEKPSDWNYCSYNSYIEPNKPTKVSRDLMSRFFKNKNDLIDYHNYSQF